MPPAMSHPLPECVEIEPDTPARRSVVWLHGLGADGHDFEPLVPELRLPSALAIRFVFPHAPRRPVTLNGGLEMRAWYDLKGADLTAGEDQEGIAEAAAIAGALLAREQERGVEPGRIVLAGFSQGGAIALYAGLRHPDRLAGLVALSTYLPLGASLPDELAAANRGTPIFQAHGRQDPIIPLAGARRSHERIAALRPAPEWHEYEMGHSVCAEEIADLRAWLLRVFDTD